IAGRANRYPDAAPWGCAFEKVIGHGNRWKQYRDATFSQASAPASPHFCRELWLPRNGRETSHVGLQHVRHGDRAVLLLISLHDGDERAADRGSRTVQGMNETRLAVAGAVARIHPAGLEIAAHRTARDFPERAAIALAGHPDLDVV